MLLKKIFVGISFSLSIWSCQQNKPETLFKQLPASQTRITFANQITESDTFNALTFEYIYNGGGVGVGDVNNDGLTDVFFAGNMVSSRLYLNKGAFHFEDISQKAGVETTQWCTGVAMVDINQDGWLDIYVSTSHPPKQKATPNLFFLNKGVDAAGNVHFEEIAGQLGLADTSYSTQAAFLDYDRDGDLDMYLLTNAMETYNRNQPVGQHTDGTGKSVDKLFRNEGNNAQRLPVFKDVSKEAGIQTEGWGLGVVVNDLNQDGYVDVYCANDFLSNDHYWINNGNGTFSNQIKTAFAHTEHNGMGADIADINNDGLNDIVVMDMMPDDNLRQKTMFSGIGYDRFFTNLKQSYQPQYVRNALQLNNGNGTFSDIGYLAGIYATDWSWSSLFADFDNDGYRDLLVTNGYRKDITDLDFLSYNKESAMFGTDESRLKTTVKAVNDLEGIKKPNFLYHNNGDLTFTNQAAAWGLAQPSYTNGAAYADLDNDGDLDLVMNNINEEAFVYENTLNSKPPGHNATNHYLRVRLEGQKPNWQGLGAKVSVYYQGQVQYAEHETTRGYKSTTENALHFGLGKTNQIDSLVVVWPTGKKQVLKSVKVDEILTLSESNALPFAAHLAPKPRPLFSEVAQQSGIDFVSTEADFADFKLQSTIPHKLSQYGPGVAVGDVNGDKLEDFYVGGSANNPGVFYLQTAGQKFKRKELVAKPEEDTGVLLFDADNDGDTDLYCVSGSSEFGSDKKLCQDRLYKNDGKGSFTLDAAALPEITASGSCVVGTDFDKDGDIDLFVGGRAVPEKYPYLPESYLLVNNGKGKFENATQIVSPEMQKPGMVTAALWTDYDNDNWTDLMVVGEWMAITLYHNEGGKKFGKTELPQSAGWWNSLAAGDFDNDGDMDYVAGNLGLNSRLKATDKEPVAIYAKDFDGSGSVDAFITCYNYGKPYSVHPRGTLNDQLITMRRQFKTFADYGKTTFDQMFSTTELKDALALKATNFSSVYMENQGQGKFALHALPVQAQISPLYGITVTDFNSDGNLDILAVGNDYAAETLGGWYDAGIGVCLKGNGKGGFQAVPVTQSGFFVNGDAKALTYLPVTDGKPVYLVTQNQDKMKVFAPNSISPKVKTLPVLSDELYAEEVLANGKKNRVEFYYGGGYLSQQSRTYVSRKDVRSVTFVNTQGKQRTVSLSN